MKDLHGLVSDEEWQRQARAAQVCASVGVTTSVLLCTCICSSSPASNERWQSRTSIRWHLACLSLFMDSFGIDCPLQWAGVMNSVTHGTTSGFVSGNYFPNHALYQWKKSTEIADKSPSDGMWITQDVRKSLLPSEWKGELERNIKDIKLFVHICHHVDARVLVLQLHNPSTIHVLKMVMYYV